MLTELGYRQKISHQSQLKGSEDANPFLPFSHNLPVDTNSGPWVGSGES